MSRRLPTSLGCILVLLFAAATAFAPFFASPAAGFGERVFVSNTILDGTSQLPVHATQSVAQSFLAPDAFRLFNVTLRLRNTGDTSDGITVSIRPDADGVPGTSSLASRTVVVGSTVPTNVDFAFATPPALSGGSRYWIVATCGSLFTNGYQWYDSNSATAYPDGEARVQGLGGWNLPSPPTDMYFVAYGRESEANLSARIVPASPYADPGDLVTFHIFLNNTGHLAATTAWLNATLQPGLTYVSDTATDSGARSGWPGFTFPNVVNGARSFQVVARVDIGTEPGAILTQTLTLEYLDSGGILRTRPATDATVFAGLRTKSLYLDPTSVGSGKRLDPARPQGGLGSQVTESLPADGSAREFDLDPALSRSFSVSGATVTLYLDSALHDAHDLDVNLTLSEWDGVTPEPVAYRQQRITTNAVNDFEAFTLAFPAIDHTFLSGNRLRLSVRNMPSSTSTAVLAFNSTFAPSRVDVATTTYVRIDVLDLRDAQASASSWSPKDALVVRANVSDPLGSGEIAGARINLTAPSGAVVVNWTAMALFATDPSVPSAWKVFQFFQAPPLALGTYTVRITAIEADGAIDIMEAHALVRAPAFTLEMTATRENVGPGDVFTYDIWFNNSGSGPAGRVWLNDTLPDGITFLGSSDPPAMTGSYNWTWTSLPPGNYRLSITVQVNASLPGIPYGRNRASFVFADDKGFSWPGLTATVDVAFRGPVLRIAHASSRPALHTNESLVYTIDLENAGDPAGTLWVNVTIPAPLAYVSHTSDVVPVIAGNRLYFQFTNLPGLWASTITVTAVAGPDLIRGTFLRNLVTLNYTNANGSLLPPRSAAATSIATAPAVPSAVVVFAEDRTTPAGIVQATLIFPNEGNEPARTLWINLSLDTDLTFLNASAPSAPSGNEVRFTLANVLVGNRPIFLNASVNPSVGDHVGLAIGGTLAYSDGLGQRMPSVLFEGDFVETSAPRILHTVSPANATVEAGARVFYTIIVTNAGSGTAGDVWLTLLLPAAFIVDTDLSDAAWTPQGSNYLSHWTNVTPGTRSLSLVLQAKPTVLDGTRANVVFRLDYTDVNHNLRPGETTVRVVDFVAPRLDMTLTALSPAARPGERVTYNLTFRNMGSTIASLWFVLDLGPAFVLEGAQATVSHSGTRLLNWTYSDIPFNRTETILLTLLVVPGAAIGSAPSVQFVATYTNSGEVILRSLPSPTATIEVLPPPLILDPITYVWLGFAGAGLVLLGAYAVRRLIGVEIEEVFLVNRDGVLIYHLSRSLSADKDEDVLSGMLTAVQEFVKDAFVYGERRNLLQLDFGEYRIMIERGRNVYLAVVYSGTDASSIRKRVLSVLRQIEAVYGSVLDKWDGDMDKVVGARDIIREGLLKTSRRPLRGLPGFP